MSISKKFLNRLFRRVNGVVWDVMSGSVGLQTDNGIFTVTFGETGAPTLNCNPLDGFGLAIPGFATQTAHADVNVGDIIVGDTAILGWVVEKKDASFVVLDHNGHQKTYVPPKVAIMNTAGVLVVKNLFSLTGSADGASNFANSLLPLLALGGGEDKLEKLIPFLLMSSQAPAAGAAPAGGGLNALLPLLLLKDGGLGGGSGDSLDKLLPLMLMGGLGGGAGGMNPLVLMSLLGKDDLLGGGTSAPALNPVRPRGVPVFSAPPPLNPI